jgi:hypothetical protein
MFPNFIKDLEFQKVRHHATDLYCSAVLRSSGRNICTTTVHLDYLVYFTFIVNKVPYGYHKNSIVKVTLVLILKNILDTVTSK